MTQAQKSSSPSILSTLVVTFLIALLVLFLLALAALIIGSVFVGVGWLMTLVFPLTLFQAALIATAAAIAFAFFLKDILRTRYPWETWGSDEEDDWDEETDDEEEDVILPPHSRNDPCPCGSGKKYKYCHGR